MYSPVASMNEERAKASFDIRTMTLIMDGGEKITAVSATIPPINMQILMA
jgi:acyl-CoA oxidase